MNQTIYENYAKLAVEIGINLQEGQDVVINASTNLATFVKEIVKRQETHTFYLKIDKKYPIYTEKMAFLTK